MCGQKRRIKNPGDGNRLKRDPQRILCMGVTGSGKSTLAAEIGRITGLPVHYVDGNGWLPGWVNRSVAEQKRLALATAAG